MNIFSLLFAFKGRISRLPYACVAVPILLIYQFMPEITNYLPLVLEQFGATLKTFALPTIIILLIINLLLLPLMAVSFKRLHDLRLTGLLALPYIIPKAIGLYYGFTKYAHLASPHQAVTNADIMQILHGVSRGCYIYGLILAVLLLITPSRHEKPGPLVTKNALIPQKPKSRI